MLHEKKLSFFSNHFEFAFVCGHEAAKERAKNAAREHKDRERSIKQQSSKAIIPQCNLTYAI